MNLEQEIKEGLEHYYNESLEKFGPGPMGMGWKSLEAQHIRFDQLAKIIGKGGNFSINDLGCGEGDLYRYLSQNGYAAFDYRGYDMLESMLLLAKEYHPGATNAEWIQLNSEEDLRVADYTIASGIFNLKYKIAEPLWLEYIKNLLRHMDKKSKRGFAFNMLTTYSDKELMVDHLYYSDPLFFFDFCKRNFSKNVALLHDYYEFDFTILVRK